MALCIIVGVGPGLGAAIARKFGSHGFSVGLIARNMENLTAISAALEQEKIVAHWRQADAGNETELRQAIAEITEICGECHTLIYNAAVLKPGMPLALDIARCRKEMEVNLFGALIAAQSVADGMIACGRGAIIFTGGGLALEPYPEWTSLAFGKSALRSLAFSLYKELAPQGVHVVVIAVCGIVVPGSRFDPDIIAAEYFRLATASNGIKDRELIFQPKGTDPFYNDPDRQHKDTTITPSHAT